MTNEVMFEKMEKLIKARIPEYETCFKDESVISKILGVLAWPFNREYMTRFTTTRYPKVFFPSRKFLTETAGWKILAHELVHLWDRKGDALHNLKYALPQLLALLVIPATLITVFLPSPDASWVDWAVVALFGCLVLPLPAYFRMKSEMRGYSMSMAVNAWRYGGLRPDTKEWIAEQFLGWGYYKMWPFRKFVMARLDKIEEDLMNGEVFDWKDAKPFEDVYAMLDLNGMLHPDVRPEP